ncbi:MAG: hypothetical protein K2O18_08600 [Oscillospiraceae bacterium]|nr:hypothetical protein [Oscillospiraceae bacterium]
MMKSISQKGFDIEINFPPELFEEKGQQNSFYDGESADERVPAAGSFRIPPSPMNH